MKKILITGATSALMNDVINRLISEDIHIFALSRRISGKHREDVEWIEADLTDPDNDFSFLKDVDTVLHAAAISNAYRKDDYMRINYHPTKTLVDSANKYGVRRFVYISSILADKSCGDYGYSKQLSERYIKNNFNNWLIIRPSQLYGYSPATPVDRLIGKISRQRVMLYPAGDRDGLYPLLFRDASSYIYDMACQNETECETKCITGPQAFNYKTLLKHIADVLDRKVLFIPVPRFIMMLLYFVLKTTGLRAGMCPDRIYRLYHGAYNLACSQNSYQSLKEYLNTFHP